MPDRSLENTVFQDYDHEAKQARGVDFTIDYNGRWYYHKGPNPGPIRRTALAALFGGAGKGFMAGKGLFRDEDGAYWLKSPDGQYGVDVEDVPFLITNYKIREPGTPDQEIYFYTNFDEMMSVDEDHPVFWRAEPQNHVAVLYIHVRAGLEARLSRAVYEDIVTRFVETDETEDGDGGMLYTLYSHGRDHLIDNNPTDNTK